LTYFDHNATTCIAPEVAQTFADAVRDVYGNASSIHRHGQLARERLEAARQAIATSLRASSSEIVFTSGGTESNNQAVLGLIRNLGRKQKHAITTRIEHPSVLEPFRRLETEGVVVDYIGVNRDGVVDAEDVRRLLRPETVLVSVMHANNEVGTIQPIAKIAEVINAHRQRDHKIFFHSDGVQAFGKVPVDIRALGVDLYSLSAHKMYGPKGIGALFVRTGTPFQSMLHGGHQERERRAGTENVPAAVAFARAVELAADPSTSKSVAALRDCFEGELVSRVDDIEIHGRAVERLPNTSNVLFHGVSGEALVIALDLQGMSASTGSACSSGSIEPSHVLLAMGRTRSKARSSVRFSFGRYNAHADITALLDAVATAVNRLRIDSGRESRLAVG
jgi:cysteine desulfurase